jgi:hypothetical protein
MTETVTLLSGMLGVDEAEVPAALSGIVGGPADISKIKIKAFGYAYGSPATGGLWQVTGDGWARFVKKLHHVRHWPGLAMMPPAIAVTFAEEFPWRTEVELWDPRIQASLPAGLRSPMLHRLVELPDDRLVLWQEDVRQLAGAWDLGRFSRAAYHLGCWNARSMAPEVLGVTPFPAGFALRMYAERAVAFRGLAPLRDAGLWQHPWLRDHGDLRAGLLDAGDRIPELLDRLDTFAQALPHGDASPQNLLVPVDDSAEFVVIDLSFRTPHALGFDLGQLLVGLVHAGELPAAEMPAVSAAIVPAYLRGLEAEGVTGRADEVRAGFAISVLLRSGFDGFRYDLLESAGDPVAGDPVAGDPAAGDPAGGEPAGEASRHAFAERVAMARFLLEQYRALA